MSVSPYLEILQLNENQAAKATAANAAIAALERALAAPYELDVSIGGPSIVLAYDTTNDLSDRQALRFIYLRVYGTPAANFELVHPNKPHMFFVFNNTPKKCTIRTVTGSGSAVEVPSLMRRLVYCDGTNFIDLGGALNITTVTASETFNVSFFAQPTAHEVIATFVIPYDGVFPADFYGFSGKALTPSTVFGRQFLIKKNGTTIGTIAFDVNTGVMTATTSGHTAQTVAKGDVLTVQFDHTDSYGISGIVFNLIMSHVVTQ